ncbi:MAG: hypothetical protein IT198_11595 [Acidimicrobiia bacterium]|nr:hypothetical protein [Acidimicrobiia bacterium]
MRVAGAALVAAGLLAACGGANRPEGPAERFLRAVSRGTDVDQVEDLGSVEVAHEVLDGPMCPVGDRPDEGVDECSENQENIAEFQVAITDATGDTAVVPIEVLRKGEDEPVRMGLEAELKDGGWRFVGTTGLDDDVAFPDEGGPGFGTDSGRVAILTLIVMGAALVVSVTLITLFSGGRPREEEADLTARHEET